MKLIYTVVLAPLALLISHAVLADSPVLMEGSDIRITQADLQAELANMGEDRRQHAQATATRLQNISENLFILRALSAQAEAKGMHQQPEVANRLQLAYEKVLGEIMLEHVDGEFSHTALQQLAEAEYRANPQRYAIRPWVEASHILITTGEQRDSEAAREKVEALLQRLEAGEDFGELAREYSEDPRSAERDGSLGRIRPGRTVAEFEEQVFDMAKGDVVGPVATRFGYHIIRLDDRNDLNMRPFAEVEEQLIEQMRQRVRMQRREAHVEKLRDPAKVTINQENIEALVVPKED